MKCVFCKQDLVKSTFTFFKCKNICNCYFRFDKNNIINYIEYILDDKNFAILVISYVSNKIWIVFNTIDFNGSKSIELLYTVPFVKPKQALLLAQRLLKLKAFS